MENETNNEDGYTLVEVMVVMLILSLIIGFVATNVIPIGDKAKQQTARADIATYGSSLDQFKLDMGSYPSEQEGLQALKTLPSGAQNADKYRTGGYVKLVKNDPWGNPYVYRFPGENGLFDILSYGADGEPGGEDNNKDIVSWEN